ncbi:MAG: four helix bundle protein [Polaribacter sp.]
MATIRKFEDLEIWQLARQLSQQVLFISKNTELKNDYRFKDQIKASSGSVMDNIAEGFERDGNLEFRQYLSIAKGSVGEVLLNVIAFLIQNILLKKKWSNLLLNVNR